MSHQSSRAYLDANLTSNLRDEPLTGALWFHHEAARQDAPSLSPYVPHFRTPMRHLFALELIMSSRH